MACKVFSPVKAQFYVFFWLNNSLRSHGDIKRNTSEANWFNSTFVLRKWLPNFMDCTCQITFVSYSSKSRVLLLVYIDHFNSKCFWFLDLLYWCFLQNANFRVRPICCWCLQMWWYAKLFHCSRHILSCTMIVCCALEKKAMHVVVIKYMPNRHSILLLFHEINCCSMGYLSANSEFILCS